MHHSLRNTQDAITSQKPGPTPDVSYLDESKRGLDTKASSSVECDINPDAEKKLVRKLDFLLLPMYALAFCTNFIDRTAIGNAKIAGIEKDLGMSGFDYNIAITVFYIFYIAVDIPSNLALKRFGSPWVAAMITAFGVVTIGTAFIESYTGLIVTRVFLGLAEGGTYVRMKYARLELRLMITFFAFGFGIYALSCELFYSHATAQDLVLSTKSQYYRRKELVLRLGLIFGASTPIAGAFGGLLASGLLSVPDFGSVKSWRKIFLIEGIITTGYGLLCFLILPVDPQHTRMLNKEERALALARIDADQAVKTHGQREGATAKLISRSFSLHTVLCTALYVMLNISFQGLSLFLPTVVATLGHYTVVQSQLRTVPPYVASAAWAIFCAYCSYRSRQRAPIIFICGLFMVAGYAIAMGTKNFHARYAACFLSLAGASPGGPLVLAWGTDNATPDTVRAVATAFIPGVGALGSVISVWTYLPADAPNYHNGNSLNLSTSCGICVLTIVGYIYLRRENAMRDRGLRDHRLQGKTPSEIERLGYLHPRFRYQT